MEIQMSHRPNVNPWATKSMAIVSVVVFMSACSAPGGGSGNWTIDTTASKCIASVVGGALLGAVIGAATGGGKNAAAGAAIGAGAGGVACAVIASLDAQDRERIRAAQLAAAQTGQPQRLAYLGNDGLQRVLSVQPIEVVPPEGPQGSPPPETTSGTAGSSEAQMALASGKRICRREDTSVEVQSKGQTDLPPQLICRDANGDWAPQPS